MKSFSLKHAMTSIYIAFVPIVTFRNRNARVHETHGHFLNSLACLSLMILQKKFLQNN